MRSEHIHRLTAAIGLTDGATGDAVVHLQDYLRRFGYLQTPPEYDAYAQLRAGSGAPQTRDGLFDAGTREALRAYQRFLGLPISGVLDQATVQEMAKPRCGVPDWPYRSGATDFAAQGSRWTNEHVTFGFQNYTADLTQAQIRVAIRAALNLWSAVTPLRFSEVTNPDIVIQFVTGQHGDDLPFDEGSNILAHAFSPSGALGGDVHFNDAEAWAINVPTPLGAVDLLTIAAHEFGHALGLGHTSVMGALMFPTYSGEQRALAADDIEGIQSIYGQCQRPTASAPSLDRVSVFGISADSSLNKEWFRGVWHPSQEGWDGIGLPFERLRSASCRENRIDVFGLGGDVLHKAWIDNGWWPSQEGWEELGGIATSAPAVVSWGTDRLDVFVLGPDRAMSHRAWAGESWLPPDGWEPLGGTFASPPAAVSRAPGLLDVFGLGVDRAMLIRTWDGTSWSPRDGWHPLGGEFTSEPAVAAWDRHRLDVLALGKDRAMYHRSWTPVDGWSERWVSLRGVFISSPAVASWGPYRLDVFAVGTNRAMYHKWWSSGVWQPEDWEPLGGAFMSPPTVATWGPNRLDIFAVGGDRAMYHKAWTGADWWPPLQEWERLGGLFL
jgi:hypothetical protein